MTTHKDILLLIDKVSEPLKKIVKNFKESSKEMDKAKASLKSFIATGNKIQDVGKKFNDVGKKMTVGVTLPLVALGGASLKASADMEAMQQQLSTMLQSEEKGAKMFNQITEMASKTPFGTKDLMQATNTMLGFGIAEERVLPLMQQLGDISGGNAQRFQSLALAFSQVSSAGKLQGQDLLQMINAGFNPLEAIAKRTGKTVGYWKEQMSKGAVSVEMVEQAMKDATSEGGRFFKMMDKQSKTALGQWSTFQDNLNMTLAKFGQVIMPYAIKALQKFSKFLEWFGKLSPKTKKFLVILGAVLAIIGPMISAIGTVITVIGTLTKVVGALNFAFAFLAANPVVLAIAAVILGVTALIAAIVLLVKNFDKVKEVTFKVAHAIADAWRGLVANFKQWISSIVGWLDELLEKLGILAYFIPGLRELKLSRNIAGAVANRINNNRTTQIQNNNTSNSNVQNTYNYGGGGVSFTPLMDSVYVPNI